MRKYTYDFISQMSSTIAFPNPAPQELLTGLTGPARSRHQEREGFRRCHRAKEEFNDVARASCHDTSTY
jgi:hypothetical protein